MSHILRGASKDGSIRIFVADTTDLVEEARKFHNTTPVVSAALGRVLTATSIMGIMMKGEKDKLTVIVKGNGPIGSITAVSDSNGIVKGYPFNPEVNIPLRPDKKLDVGTAVGSEGVLSVIKDLGMKEPYNGQFELVNGEIAEDLTAYFAYSEQQPSAVALGVLVDKDYTIKASGGFIVQLMPDAHEESIEILEKNLEKIQSVSHLIEEGFTSKEILNIIMKDLEPVIYDEINVRYFCDCSRDRIEEALISLGNEEIQSIIDEDEEAEIVCHFCNKKYHFEKKDLKNLIK